MDDNNRSNKPQGTASAPVLDVQPSQQNDMPESPSEPAVTETGAPDPVKRPEIAASNKHGAPVVPIIIALVIAAALAVVTILAFKNAEKAAAPTTNNSTQQEAELTPESVDAATSEIDQSLNEVDEAADFPEDELSDQNLGL